METDIDNNKSDNRAAEFEQQLMMEQRAANSNKTDVYLNAYESSALKHEYKNLNQHDLNEIHAKTTELDHSKHLDNNHDIEMNNPYEDDVQTVHSEGIRSEMEHAPPLHTRPHHQNQQQQEEDDITQDIENEICTLTLGDISEADDRVKKFYGIIPKDNKEIKTVRMVKRDSKERSTSALGNGLSQGNNVANKYYDDIREDDSQNMINEHYLESDHVFKNGPPPPPPLPRGNYGQNLHNFLSTQQSSSNNELQNGLSENMENIIDLTSTSKSVGDKNGDTGKERKFRGQVANDDEIIKSSGSQKSSTSSVNGPTSTNGSIPKTNFVLGEYQRRKSKVVKV